jgi:hypothetical protein
MVKIVLSAIALVLLAAYARAADEVYVRMQGVVHTILSNGDDFEAEKGDYFPFVGYDGAQTLMELKFGPLTFWVRKEEGKIVPSQGEEEAAEKYAAATEKLLAATEKPRNWFPVDASCPEWQNTGILVKAGQTVLVEANPRDKWNGGNDLSDADGYNYPVGNAGVPVFHEGQEAVDWHWMALIGAVGKNRQEIKDSRNQVEIGLKRKFTVDSDGFLYFIANDDTVLPNDRGNGFDDNSGIIHVKVTVTDPAGSPAEDR